MLAAADKWVTDLEKRFRKRDFKTTVVDINGKSVFITRFFKPLAPPDSVAKKEESSKHAMVRLFVDISLLLFLSLESGYRHDHLSLRLYGWHSCVTVKHGVTSSKEQEGFL